MLKIRFFRTGKKNQPFFKIVVIENKRASKGGRFVEELGFRNPLTKENSLKKDRIKYWISVGAQVSDSIHNLLIQEKVLEGVKIPLHKKKKGKDLPAEEGKDKEAGKEVKEPKVETPKEEPKEEPKAEVEEEAKETEEPKKEVKQEEEKKLKEEKKEENSN
jgi:small subunit ribosomal protein S16